MGQRFHSLLRLDRPDAVEAIISRRDSRQSGAVVDLVGGRQPAAGSHASHGEASDWTEWSAQVSTAIRWLGFSPRLNWNMGVTELGIPTVGQFTAIQRGTGHLLVVYCYATEAEAEEAHDILAAAPGAQEHIEAGKLAYAARGRMLVTLRLAVDRLAGRHALVNMPELERIVDRVEVIALPGADAHARH